MPSFKLRVWLRDDGDVRQLLWIEHRGKDVFAGLSGSRAHTSYHASGQRHTKDGQIKLRITTKLRLERLDGLREASQLQMLSLYPEPCWHSEQSPFKRTAKTFKDGILLNAQILNRGSVYCARVGIVGADGEAALQRFEALLTRRANWVVEQRVLERRCTPWLFAILLRHSPATEVYGPWPEDYPLGIPAFIPAPGFACSGDLNDGGAASFHFEKGRIPRKAHDPRTDMRFEARHVPPRGPHWG